MKKPWGRLVAVVSAVGVAAAGLIGVAAPANAAIETEVVGVAGTSAIENLTRGTIAGVASQETIERDGKTYVNCGISAEPNSFVNRPGNIDTPYQAVAAFSEIKGNCAVVTVSIVKDTGTTDAIVNGSGRKYWVGQTFGLASTANVGSPELESTSGLKLCGQTNYLGQDNANGTGLDEVNGKKFCDDNGYDYVGWTFNLTDTYFYWGRTVERDLIAAKYAGLEKSDVFQGTADHDCQGIGDPKTITFEDIDFQADCNNTYGSYNGNSGMPGLALPYQVFELEGVTDTTYRFKPHCVEGYRAYWGNRVGPTGTMTYGCIPTPETCEAVGGEWTSYTHPYGYEAFYCNLYGVPDFEVTLTGPTQASPGEKISYTATINAEGGLADGTLTVTSRNEVVRTDQISADSCLGDFCQISVDFNVTVPKVEAESKEDLAYPLQAFYEANDKLDSNKTRTYESAVLVTTVVPDPEMCLALGSDPGITVRSADIDGDGVANVADSDMDGDGIPNTEDSDIDGDGTVNAADSEPEGPPARPVPPSLWDEEKQQELANQIQDHVYGEDYPSTFPLPVDPQSGEEETFAEGAGVIVPAPSYEAVTEVLQYAVDDACGIDNNWGGNAGGVDPGTGGGTTPPGAYPILGDGGSANGEEATGGAAPQVRLIMPSQVYQGVETDLAAEVDATDGTVEFAVQEIDLNGNQTARIIGSSPVNEDGVATIDVTPEQYGDAIVYARYTGRSGVDTTAGATVVYPAPFIDEFTLKVNGDYWTEMPKGEVLPYGYHKVEYTTDSGNAPRLEVSGPCQVMSTKSIPPQITMLGTAIAPKRCTVTVSTGGYDAYAPKSWTFDVANTMGNQTATPAAAKAKRTMKKGSMVTLATKNQTKTDEDYEDKGKKITWSVTSGKDVCAVKASSSGKVSVKGKKKGTCTVNAKASKVSGKYKAFSENYTFTVK